MSDLFREIDEEVRRDRAIELWKRYGNHVIGAAIAVVIGTGIYVAWRDYERRQAAEQGAQFFAAAQSAAAGQTGEAERAFGDLAANASSGYATLARLREAALKAKGDEKDGAIAIYRSLASDSASAELRDAATLLAAWQAADSISADELDRRLMPILAETSPWRHSALELTALVAIRSGDVGKARQLYTQIADDPGAPTGLRSRAAEMLAVLGT